LATQAPIQHIRTSEERSRLFARLERGIQLRYLLLVAPGVLFLFVFYGYPVAAMLMRAFNDPVWGFANFDKLTVIRSHENWYLFSMPMNAYIRVFTITLRIALVVTVITLLLAYPVAYVLSSISAAKANLLMILVLVPFWTSILVRSYAWMVLLGREGTINRILIRSGIRDEPMQLLNTRFAVYVGMVHILLPFMILPLYSVMRGIDRNYLRAAENLGGRPSQVFRHVFLPLSLPGIGAGSLVVFILPLGFYITPALIGGPRDVMISMMIFQQVNVPNWGFASALALILLVIAIVIYLVFNKILGVEQLYGGTRK
jgi:putative spermidine/putrescine transport system permease protein